MYKRLVAFTLVFLFLLSISALAEDVSMSNGIVYYQYGDTFEATLYNAQGDEVALPDVPSLVIYVSAECETCLTLTSQLPQLFEILGDEFVNILILWQDVIPTEHVNMYHLPMSNCLTLAGKAQIGGITPSVYIIDEKGIVRFCDTDMKRAVEKLLSKDYYPNGYLVERADRYLQSQMKTQEEKVPLLYFAMTGCPDCAEADDAMQGNPEIDELFSITRIHRYNETNPEKWTDYFSLIVNIYGITWYPSFLVFNGGISTLVGQVPIDTLCDLLIAAIERY